LRAGAGVNETRTRWHCSNPVAAPFRLFSRDLAPAAGSRSGRREDDVEADPRPGTVPEIAVLGRGRARGLVIEVPHQGVPDASPVGLPDTADGTSPAVHGLRQSACYQVYPNGWAAVAWRYATRKMTEREEGTRGRPPLASRVLVGQRAS
jgi:hypothetical protein